jgi:aminoglycoside phosphotransferase (APT) family kinase protein
VLAVLQSGWPRQFAARVIGERAITLIHGDFHCFGNVMFAPGELRPRVIDWSELKPGLGPHDLAYCVAGLDTADRVERDLALLRHYWEGLCAAGVTHYSWELCHWDFRFSLFANLFQSMFQGSDHWYRRAFAAIRAHRSYATLSSPPPIE